MVDEIRKLAGRTSQHPTEEIAALLEVMACSLGLASETGRGWRPWKRASMGSQTWPLDRRNRVSIAQPVAGQHGAARTLMDASASTLESIDLNSGAASHNRRFPQDWTGRPEEDRADNRAKCFFPDNRVRMRGARHGLGEAETLPDRAGRSDFPRVADLARPASEADAFLVPTPGGPAPSSPS